MLDSFVRRSAIALGLAVATACGPSPIIVARPVDATVAQDNAQTDPKNAQLVADEAGDAESPIPVSSRDPQWGERGAPVTIVEFSDLQCPYCRKVSGTIKDLQHIYGPTKLRVVWKNYPLEFHRLALPAAERGMAIFERRGDAAFFAYVDAIFDGGALDEAVMQDAVKRAGMSDGEIEGIAAQGGVRRKIGEDLALVQRLEISGTPAFFVNGVKISGAVPIEDFRKVIDAELDETKKLVASGTKGGFYAKRSAENVANKPAEAKAPPPPPPPPEDTTTVWNVPVAGSPIRGNANALVTVVEFADFQCQFCLKAQAVLNQIASSYGNKVRLVYKAQPLAFHKNAEPAAELAFEVRAKKGDAAFWRVYDVLYTAPTRLEDADLRAAAKTEGLDPDATMRAVAAKKHVAKIADDQDLADGADASATPTFFINGRRLVGAQPFEKFQGIIDDELAKTEAIVQGGVAPAKVYDKLIANGKTNDHLLEKITVPAPTKANPSRGPANAKVTIQVFGDFECPFCGRAEPTLAELDKLFPNKIRWVWRNRPLSFHPNAEPAAEAAMEAFKQKGSVGFWSMHDLLFADQAHLDRQSLEAHAKKVGLDLKRFGAALDGASHKAEIDADAKVADDAKISGTPTFVINDRLLTGAQSLGRFRRAVARELGEKKKN